MRLDKSATINFFAGIFLPKILLIALFLSAGTAAGQSPAARDGGLIDLWYGAVQHFGGNGQPQRWINVLGTITEPGQVASVTYALNGGSAQPLTLGGDQHRLARAGDFNVELDWNEVHAGDNELLLTATRTDGTPERKRITLRIAKGRTWPLPYHVDFSRTEDLQAAVQVVDGHWRLHDWGVRTAEPYYDRVLTMGDTSWTDYEATVRLTIHGFTPSKPGPPTYNVTHFGVAMRWRGHHRDGRQPGRKWFPLGAQGEFLLKENPDNCRWRILFDGIPEKPPTWSGQRNTLVLGQPMRVKAQVATLPDGRTRYRFKQWLEARPEPLHWDVEGYETSDYPSGALCLVPHNSDVTIHEVSVEPLSPPLLPAAARPGPGALHFSAPVGGLWGARGGSFAVDCLGPADRLLALQVNLGPAPLRVVRGFRLRLQGVDGKAREALIGRSDGEWQDWWEAPQGARPVGISGASGWLLDALQFHFDDGSRSPRYGGSGGDTTFHLQLNRQSNRYGGRLRGFHGTATEDGLETLGLIFDPAE